jgi:large subunit ribosomal protein L24
MKSKIRKGDTVEVISGREADKGKRGEVIRVMPDEQRVQTQGRRNLNPGIIEFEAPISIANVMLVCPKCDEPSRIGIRRDGDEVQRLCKNCQNLFD